MEKDRQIFARLVRLGVLAGQLSSLSPALEANAVVEMSPPRTADSAPPRELSPGIDLIIISSPSPLPSPTPEPTTTSEPSPTLTPEQTVDYVVMNGVIAEMKARPDLFSQRKIEDVKTYFPIYAAVGQAYDVDWEILWIIHERESTASTNPDAFNGRSAPYYGAVQRSNVWSDEYVDEAVDEKNLQWLQYLPQRHPDDYRELAFAGRFLYEHRLKYMNKGYKKDTAFLLALGNFNNPQSGRDRYNEDKFLKKEVFKD
jgi:hypothetical protein